MWWIAIAVWGVGIGQAVPRPLQPEAIACLGAQSVIGEGEDSRLLRHDGTGWQRLPFDDHATQLWRAPDGRVLAEAWHKGRRVALELREGAATTTRWVLPEDEPFRFELVDGHPVAVSVKRRYRLDPNGAVVELGPTPLSPKAMRPYDAPVLLRWESGTVICEGTSLAEAHSIIGHCVSTGPAPYDYRTEFNAPFGDPARDGVDPFICADVVISAHSRGTQARRLTDGVQVARAPLYARHGSQCLPGNRVLIVGEHEVGIFGLPGLQRLWRLPLGPKVKDVAFCGGKLAVIRKQTSTLTMLAVPQELIGPAATPH